MILFIEPISRNIDMYVPAYPLPLLEVASFVKQNLPDEKIRIISIPVDYGLPLTQGGREIIYRELLHDISKMAPRAVGISCTAIAQAEEVIDLCERIKKEAPEIVIFLGGYFPTIYYEEIFSRTSAVDMIVIGEGEVPALRIIDLLRKGGNPLDHSIQGLAWQKNGRIFMTQRGPRFDLRQKALLNLDLLAHPKAYDILPYAFSRGCPYHCNFCMEAFIRPSRQPVPSDIVLADLNQLSQKSQSHSLLISDALFKSFELFPAIQSYNMKVNFETRCDVMDPSSLSRYSEMYGAFALGFESASYGTLKRMNKVRDKAHFRHYVDNTIALFRAAVQNDISIMVFMIAGYPGDTEQDLIETLRFAEKLSRNSGPGGHLFKIGECRVYPKTQLYTMAKTTPGVVFDDLGVFGENIVRRPSEHLNFETVLDYMGKIFNLSNTTPKLQKTLLNMMPFFRVPAHALRDTIIPDTCFRDKNREVLDVRGESLWVLRSLLPELITQYKDWTSKERSARELKI